MAIHAPLIRVWSLGWVVVAIVAIALGMSAIARRRGLARMQRLQRMKMSPIVTVPARGQASGGRSMRQFVWSVVVVLIVLAALTTGVSVRTDNSDRFSTAFVQMDPTMPGPPIMIAPTPVLPSMPPHPPQPHKKIWFKSD